MTDGSTRPAGGRRRLLLRLLGLAVAAALITVVVRTVPWQDSLLLRVEGDGGSEGYAGAIQGSWRADQVRFVFDPELEPGPLAEANGLAEPIRAGAEVAVARTNVS